MKNQPQPRSTLRRRVREAGGYYSRESRAWVLPGAISNLVPWQVDTVRCASLEEAAGLCDAHAAKCASLREFERAEELRIVSPENRARILHGDPRSGPWARQSHD